MTQRTGITWTVIINSTTCRRSREWLDWLADHQIVNQPFYTSTLSELLSVLDVSYKNGNRHYLFVGGDGTLHQGVNTLLQVCTGSPKELVVSLLPCGTGNDWVRSFGRTKVELATALKGVDVRPMHLLQIEWPNGKKRYAVNMLGGGLDASVVYGLRNFPWKWPSFILYPMGLIAGLLKPHHWEVRIETNEGVFEKTLLTLQAGFGKYCGGGMYVLPFADGEIPPALLMITKKSLISIMMGTAKLYNGQIANQRQAISSSFMSLEVSHKGRPFPIEADGEFLGYSPFRATALPNHVWRI